MHFSLPFSSSFLEPLGSECPLFELPRDPGRSKSKVGNITRRTLNFGDAGFSGKRVSRMIGDPTLSGVTLRFSRIFSSLSLLRNFGDGIRRHGDARPLDPPGADLDRWMLRPGAGGLSGGGVGLANAGCRESGVVSSSGGFNRSVSTGSGRGIESDIKESTLIDSG